MTKRKTFLPFPLFVFILLIVGYGIWYTVKNLTFPAQPLDINVITETTNSCQGKANGSSCEYQFCPPCSQGNQCSQQEFICYPTQGNCFNNVCRKVGSEPELTYEQYTQLQSPSPSPSPSPSISPSPSASAQAYVFLDGDFDQSKSVDIFDYNALVTEFTTKYTIFDYNNLTINFGKTSP